MSQLEIWAQKIYSPSYISCEWALQYYGLLTDRVMVITSVCLLKSVNYKTPVRSFSFEHITKKRYPVGYRLEKSFFIARSEKALLDYINLRIDQVKWSSSNDIAEFLEDDVRLKTRALVKMADPNFKLEPYFKAVQQSLESFGFKVEIDSVEKTENRKIESAF